MRRRSSSTARATTAAMRSTRPRPGKNWRMLRRAISPRGSLKR